MGSLTAQTTPMVRTATFRPRPKATMPGIGDDAIARGGVLVTTRHHRVAPGIDLTAFSRLEEGGWNNARILTVDLCEPTLSMDVVDTGEVASVAVLPELVRPTRTGARAVAAVNGTFFDMDRSGAPVYTSISSRGIRVGVAVPRPALTITDGRAAIEALSVAGTLTSPDGTVHAISGINPPELCHDGIGLYTDAWGHMPLDRALTRGDEEPARAVARATVVGSTIVEAATIQDGRVGDLSLPAGGHVLLGRDAGARVIGSLTAGEEIGLAVGPDPDVDLGLAGSHQVLVGGAVPAFGDEETVTGLHARTVVGLSEDGHRLFVLVVDGGSSDSHGMNLPEAATLMQQIGAHDALNLDGGGSSALAARVAGAEAPTIRNTPSDGKVREVANALVFSTHADPVRPTGVQIALALEDQDAVLPGLHRTLTATGLAADLSPVSVDGVFTADGDLEAAGSDDGSDDGPGAARVVVTGLGRGEPGRGASAVGPGSGTVRYRAGDFEDHHALRVLGKTVGLVPSARILNIADPDSSRILTLTGIDADGHTARIETQDAIATTSDGFTLEDDRVGTWSVAATGTERTGTLTLQVGDLRTEVTLTVGTEETHLLDLSDPSAFSDAADRATGCLRAAGGAIGMRFDFTASAATRGYYLVPAEEIPVDGTALAFTLDVRGDGHGAWPRLQVRDGNGTVTDLDGDHLEFDGWRRIRFPVPDGLAQPLAVRRLRIMETRPQARYTGDIAVANLQAITAPAAPAPAHPALPAPAHPGVPARVHVAVHDAALLAVGTVVGRPQQVAVMSDAQFVGRDPDSPEAQGARRTLREIAAHRPDLLVIDGDFVDEGAPEDLALARRILDEEWDPAIPYLYVPGNHEVMGGDIATFHDVFGAVTGPMTLGGTRILTLDSSSGSLAGGGLDQIARLQAELAQAASDDTLTGVLVFLHHPTRDPLPDENSRLEDRREAAALEELCARFRQESGRSVAMVAGHVGVFHVAAIEGVTCLINGNAAKAPHGTGASGGFVGWTMLGIDPAAGRLGTHPSTQQRVRWLAAEIHPLVEDLTLDVPTDLHVGQRGRAAATVHQGGRAIPATWPVTSQWGGAGVEVDVDAGGPDEEEQRDSAVVRVDPLAGQVTGLRPGTATLEVSVNGVSARTIITVHAA
jgi:hypothetical protein